MFCRHRYFPDILPESVLRYDILFYKNVLGGYSEQHPRP